MKIFKLLPVIVALMFVSCPPKMCQYKPSCTPFDMNGIYRGRFSYPENDTTATSRGWGDWIEIRLEHAPIYLENCQPRSGATHKITGTVRTYYQFGAENELFAFDGGIDLGAIEGYHYVYGAIRKIGGSDDGKLYPVKIMHFEAQRQGSSPCSTMPNVTPMSPAGSNKNHFIQFEITGPTAYDAKTVWMEQCAVNNP
jgi:hypothetical protein